MATRCSTIIIGNGLAEAIAGLRTPGSGPRVLLASQPTRGVDIGAAEYIHERIAEQRQRGTASIVISEDLDEVMALSDRIAVMFDGQIMGIVERDQATRESIGLLMTGETQKAPVEVI